MAQGNGKKVYSLKGKIENWNDRFIYFSCKGFGSDRIWDSTIVKNNAFEFKGVLEEPSNGFITTLKWNRIKNLSDKNITERLFISPSQMTITLKVDSFHNAKLIGSKLQMEYLGLENSKKKFYNKIDPLSKLYDSLNDEYIKTSKLEKEELIKEELSEKLDSLRNIFDTLNEKCSLIDRAFFKKNPNSYITAYLLKDYYSSISLAELEYYYNKMHPETKKWEYGIKLKEAIGKLQKGSPGGIPYNFTSIDLNGNVIALSQFKGKYVLLDFWASWCKPCRAGNPELINLYKKYKDNGIEFVGIADDDGSEDKWKLAIKNDKINIWRQILDMGIGEKYAVHSIPLQILINPKGVIVNRFGEGGEPNENLSKVLESIFGK
jgi:thiol-disulfide isomerase/thioredoxin